MNNLYKVVGPLSIDWTGFKRVLIHTGIVALATVVAYIFAQLKAYNFGDYQAIATIIIGFVFTFAEKFFSSYNVPLALQDTPTSAKV
jgi:hypothetical protein